MLAARQPVQPTPLRATQAMTPMQRLSSKWRPTIVRRPSDLLGNCCRPLIVSDIYRRPARLLQLTQMHSHGRIVEHVTQRLQHGQGSRPAVAKVRFGMSGLLLTTVFSAVSVLGPVAAARLHPRMATDAAFALTSLAPFWLPFVFGAFAFGKKRLTWTWMAAFVISEAAAVGGLWLLVG